MKLWISQNGTQANLSELVKGSVVVKFDGCESNTSMSVLEEGYLIEEGGLTKFQKCYNRGV